MTAAFPRNAIRKLGPADAEALEAHCLRLAPSDALDVLGSRPGGSAARSYVAGIDFERDIVVAGFDDANVPRATARIRADAGSRCADLLVARERERTTAGQWHALVRTAVTLARDASLGWLSVSSLGYDAETRAALTAAGFVLHVDEEGTIGDLCLARCGPRKAK